MDTTASRRASWAVIALCAVVVVAEGYDLIVFGALLPSLLAEPGWGLDSASAGTVGSVVYLGMLVGALVGGRAADRFGRRPFVVAAVACSAVFTLACAFAGGPWQLAALRLLAGLGMGAVIPAVLALAKEHAPPGREALTVALLMAGIPAGGTAASLLALVVLPAHGWRPMFVLGGAISLVVFVVALRWLPESRAFTAPDRDTRPVSELFAAPYAVATVLFAAATFANLLTWYGLNTWLTTLMRELDYPLSSALQFSLTLNLSAIVGSLLVARAGDRWGARPVAAVCSVLTALALLALALGTTGVAMLLAFVAVLGVSAQSALNMINTAVAETYPTGLRSTALGATNGIGRTGAVLAPSLGGWLLAAGLGPTSVFGTFLASSLVAAVLLAVLTVLGRRRARSAPAPGTTRAPTSTPG